MSFIFQKKYFVLLLTAALFGCAPTAQQEKASTEVTPKEQTDTVATEQTAVLPGTYCYNKEDLIARIDIDDDGLLTGQLQGGSAGEEAEYTLYTQAIEGSVIGKNLKISIITSRRDKEDILNTETWKINDNELVTDKTTLEMVDCDDSGINLVLDQL